ncbi:hypothetical protein DPMN_064991 [Dreissena polymorpha]|uniref:Uncharacterized protein n=1 Tax=Dreissena polymorpha TaxID=45954 RepID=A0A9D4HKM7_DREPO|nr:hypothetical protein DPMN_064991 [Dreissena polymorpha]
MNRGQYGVTRVFLLLQQTCTYTRRTSSATSFFVWALSIGPVFCLVVRAHFCEALT